MDTETRNLLSTREFAKNTGYNQQVVTAMCRDGRLPAIKVGSRWRIDTSRLAWYREGMNG